MPNLKKINELYGSAVAGLCILKPVRNYFFSQPIKIYEYMAAGLPYICSDFPLWQELAVASSAGICVNPENTAELSKAISTLLADRKKHKQWVKKDENMWLNTVLGQSKKRVCYRYMKR